MKNSPDRQLAQLSEHCFEWKANQMDVGSNPTVMRWNGYGLWILLYYFINCRVKIMLWQDFNNRWRCSVFLLNTLRQITLKISFSKLFQDHLLCIKVAHQTMYRWKSRASGFQRQIFIVSEKRRQTYIIFTFISHQKRFAYTLPQ